MNDPSQRFNNNSTAKERREVLRDTMQFRTSADLGLENSGRFAKPFHVTGSTPAPNYPAASSWNADPTGVEPPLNQDVNSMEPVGEIFEIERSIGARHQTERVGAGTEEGGTVHSQPIPSSNNPNGEVVAPRSDAPAQLPQAAADLVRSLAVPKHRRVR